VVLTPTQMEVRLEALESKNAKLEETIRTERIDSRIPLLATEFDVEDAVFFRNSKYIVKAAAETIDNSDTLQDDNDFTFSIGASEVWLVEMGLLVTGTTVADFKATWSLPSGASMLMFMVLQDTSVQSEAEGTTPGTAFAIGLATSNAAMVHVMATLRNAGTVGPATFQWAQNTQEATNLTLGIDSLMTAHRV